MKKLLVFVGVIAGIYLALAVAAWVILPNMIGEVESRLPALEMAEKNIYADREKLSEIIKGFSTQRQSREDSLDSLLADSELNKLAMRYLGKDFSLLRRAYVGKLHELKGEGQAQSKADTTNRAKKLDEELHRKIVELEHRRHSLANKISKGTFGYAGSDERRILMHVRDVDLQLSALRAIELDRKYRKAPLQSQAGKSQAAMSASLYSVVAQYERDTLGVLSETMNAQIDVLRSERDKATAMRGIISVFNIWPLNVLVKLPQPAES